VQDGTGKTALEIMNMAAWDRQLTALIRARYYKEKNREAEQAQQNSRL